MKATIAQDTRVCPECGAALDVQTHRYLKIEDNHLACSDTPRHFRYPHRGGFNSVELLEQTFDEFGPKPFKEIADKSPEEDFKGEENGN